MTYEAWIADYLKTVDGNPYAKCREAVAAMAKQFPELIKCRGHVQTSWGRREHWWLKTQEAGIVVDPTAGQFPGGVGAYEELAIGSLVRVGRCMNCGHEIWRPATSLTAEPPPECICSAECHDDFAAYLEREDHR